MKKGEELIGYVDHVNFPNKGIVWVEEEREKPDKVQKEEKEKEKTDKMQEEEKKEKTDTDSASSRVKVSVKGVLPEQTIKFRLTKNGSGKKEGALLEVLKASGRERRVPSCPHFGTCGGCTYQTMPYEEQLRLKEEQVKRLLKDFLEEGTVWEGILKSPVEFAYRNKMEYSFGDEIKNGPLTLGMHKKGSFYDVLTTNHCQIVHEDFNRILDATLAVAKEFGVTYYHKMTHSGYLRHLLVRRAVKTGEILVHLVTSSVYTAEKTRTAEKAKEAEETREVEKAQEVEGTITAEKVQEAEGTITAEKAREAEGTITAEKAQGTEGTITAEKVQEAEGIRKAEKTEENQEQKFLEAWRDAMQRLSLEGSIKGILHIVNDRVADAILADRMEILDGEDFFFEELLGLTFKISTFSFFQTNSLGAEVLYKKVREYVGETENKIVYDLYSGTGTIAQLLAPVAKKVIGVEIVADAVDAARGNAEKNGLVNCEFIAGDVLKVLDGVEEKPDYIVLDPPRDGVHPKALEKIVAYGVERMVYISCKPTSLARDLVVLREAGYKVEQVCMVDMFPETVNVETIALLSRK